jgi:mannose-1-phosphate guanylyltransferase
VAVEKFEKAEKDLSLPTAVPRTWSVLVDPQIHDPNYGAVILAGGDGVRLSSFTRQVFGRHFPKQFCPLFKGETLLEQTMRRVSLLVPPTRTITVLNCAHERFYCRLLSGTAFRNLLIQPENRGTAPAILCALMRFIEAGHTGAVAIFPSDHYVSDDCIFMRQVSTALRAVDLSPQLIVLLGIAPDGPETEYGWIEPGAHVATTQSAFGQIRQIRRFWEKPSSGVARNLYDRGYLWNSFVLIANAPVLMSLIARALPELYPALTRIRPFLGTARENEVLRTSYRDLPTVDFSGRVLAQFPAELAVLPVTGVSWSDLGDPKRLLAVISNSGRLPQWADSI